MGRYGGALAGVRPDDLGAHAIKAVIKRTGLDPERISDVYWGAANQAGEDNRDAARMCSLLAGVPVEVPGVTVNRLCASGLEAVNSASRAIRLGEGDIYLAGGAESMSRAPWVVPKPLKGLPRGPETMHDTALGWRLINPRMAEMHSTESMGETAENVAERYGISREDQDAFALRSHRRAVAAMKKGVLSEEIVPIEVPSAKKVPGTVPGTVVDADEGPRPDASLESLAKLRAVFRDGGTVTAGNASTLNDGAAAIVMAGDRGLDELGAEPLARIVAIGVAGVDPAVMGIGPIPAIRKALEAAKLELGQIGRVEINEAFAAQVLACQRELGIDPEILNVNGGAIALGHPFGMTGARIMTTLIHNLQTEDKTFGMESMCVGGGQGMAMIVERLS
jgi:3-oxoadipyl-CoA thiolase